MGPNVINYRGNEIRTVVDKGTLFVSISDIARALDMHKGRLTRIKFPSRVFTLKTGGGMQPVAMIDHSSAITLLFRSKKPGAEDLRKWFMEDVLKINLNLVEMEH